MASIVKHGSHSFEAFVSKTGYARQTKTFETKREANDWATVVGSEMRRGVFVDRAEAERTSLKDALQRYFEEVKDEKKSAAKDQNTLRRWMASPLSLRSLASLSSADFAAYRDVRKKEVSASTIRTELSFISSLFTTAIEEWGLPLINPISNVKKPKLPKGRSRRLEGNEEQRLMSAAIRSKAQALPLAIQLAVETGMRAGEIVNLTWHQIDLKECVIRLDDSKNGDARVVPLTEEAERILRGLVRPLDASARLTTFHDPNGLSAAFRRACMNAAIEGMRFHDLRHEAASRFAPIMEVATLAKVMGWRSIQMAMRYYNPKEKELVAAVRRRQSM